jgi:choline dehydrogenase-like flavoprotein
MAIARDEVFGPVLSVLTFGTLDEAMALANDADPTACRRGSGAATSTPAWPSRGARAPARSGPTPGWTAFPKCPSAARVFPSEGNVARQGKAFNPGADVLRLETDEENRISAIVYRHNGEEKRLSPELIVLSAGAVRSSVLLMKSANGRNPNGLANSSDQVGRNFMNHNATFMLAIDPRTVNDSVYQKTLHFNDFYFDDGKGSGPLGQVQLLGRVTAPIMKSRVPVIPEWALKPVANRAVDWYLVSEDLPRPESRVRIGGEQVILDWQFSNMAAHYKLVERTREVMKAAGYPIILTQLVGGRLPSHQCGTVRIGNDPATAPLDPWCRSHDHANLFVMDAGFLPTSAAVNPSLTVAAQALRVADYIRRTELKS